MRTNTTRLVASILIVMFGITFNGAVGAEETAENFKWWTLTDRITPSQLQAIHEDPALHRERYLQAVREGHRDSLPEEDLRRVRSFFSGRSTPELLPLWITFNAFSTHLYGEGRSEINEKAESLIAFGFDLSTAERIVLSALLHLDSSQDLAQELKDDAWAFAEILSEAEKILGRTATDDAVKSNGVDLLAMATSRNPVEVARLKKVWERRPIEEIAAGTLGSLRHELSEKEWRMLKDYLLLQVAPMISTIDFTPVEEAR